LGEIISRLTPWRRKFSQEVLDVRDLLRVVLLRVREDDFHLWKVLRTRGDFSIHGDAPRFAEIALGEADEKLRLASAAAGGAAHRSDEHEQQANACAAGTRPPPG
jgi:hypothetical protein